MNFCSNCGSKNLAFEIPEGDTYHRHVCKDCGTIHYRNPKLIVGCLPVWEDKVVLCRRAIEPRLGLWNLPAGFMENGETVEQGAAREMKEETGADVQIERLHAVYSLPHIHQVYMHFVGKLTDVSQLGPTSESLEVLLFREEDIPWEEMAFSSSKFALEKYFEYRGGDFQGVHRGFLDKKGY